MGDTITPKVVQIFYCYAREDEELRNELAKHLAILERLRLAISWHDRKIYPGDEWKREIDRNLDNADIVLLLISATFISSDYCYDVEMQQALDRYRRGKTRVIPIVLSPSRWQEIRWRDMSMSDLQTLPKDGKPVTEWNNRDAAWDDITKSVLVVVKRYFPQKLINTGQASQQTAESSPPAKTESSPVDDRQPQSVDKLLQEFRGASYPGNKERAARALGSLGSQAASAVPALRKALKDPSVYVRNAAAWALGEIDTEDARQAIKEFERR